MAGWPRRVRLARPPNMEFTATQKRASAWLFIALISALALWLLGPALTLFVVLALVIPGLAAPAFSRVFIDRVLGSEDHSILLPLIIVIYLMAFGVPAGA